MPALQINNDVRNNKDNICDKMHNDIECISKAIKAQRDFSHITFPAPDELSATLKNIVSLVDKIKEKALSESAKQRLRCYIFLISRHKSRIYSAQLLCDPNSLGSLETAIAIISDKIGVVPCLKSKIELPSSDLLPAEFKKTVRRWSKQPCANPTRGSTSTHNEIYFMRREGKTAAIRQELKARAMQDKRGYIEIEKDHPLFLNMTDLDYYNMGLMHADHFQSSTSLIDRIKEMITVMNYDPTFREEMEKSSFNEGCFLPTKKGEIVGSYWLYMSYHNSMQNVWFLLASDNTTSGGKAVEDPVEWLQRMRLGHEYIVYLEGSNKFIDKSDILYCVSDGIPLKESFVHWVKKYKKPLIKVYQDIARHKGKQRAEAMDETEEQLRSRRVKMEVLAREGLFSGKPEMQTEWSSGESEEFFDEADKQFQTRGGAALLADLSKKLEIAAVAATQEIKRRKTSHNP